MKQNPAGKADGKRFCDGGRQKRRLLRGTAAELNRRNQVDGSVDER